MAATAEATGDGREFVNPPEIRAKKAADRARQRAAKKAREAVTTPPATEATETMATPPKPPATRKATPPRSRTVVPFPATATPAAIVGVPAAPHPKPSARLPSTTVIMWGLAIIAGGVSVATGWRCYDTLVLVVPTVGSAVVQGFSLVAGEWVIGWAVDELGRARHYLLAAGAVMMLLGCAVDEIWLAQIQIGLSIHQDVGRIMAEQQPACKPSSAAISVSAKDLYGYTQGKTDEILSRAGQSRQEVRDECAKQAAAWKIQQDARIKAAQERPDFIDRLLQLGAALGAVVSAFFIPLLGRAIGPHK